MGKAPDKPEPFLPLDMKASTNLIYWLANAHGMALLPFIRTGFGQHGIGLSGVLAWVIIWGYAGLADAPGMLLYFAAWLAFVVYRKLTADTRQMTSYQGYPLLTGGLFHNELTARLAEAGLMWIVGGIVSALVSEAIGQFVGFGTFSLGVKYMIESAVIERQKEAAHDAITTMEIQHQRMEEVTRRR